MKKLLNVFVVILAILSGFAIGYFFLLLWQAALEGYGKGMESLGLLGSVVISLVLFVGFLWLWRRGRVGSSAPALFAVLTFVAFVGMVWFVVATPLQKEFRLVLDDNPLLYGGEPVGVVVDAGILTRQYWMNRDDARASLTEIYNKKEKDSRLIKFSHPKSMAEIIGVSEEVVVAAFGEPARRQVEGEYEVWTYYPWSDHADWEMPVYVSREHGLLGVGVLFSSTVQDPAITERPTCPDVCTSVCAGLSEPELPPSCPIPMCACDEPGL